MAEESRREAAFQRAVIRPSTDQILMTTCAINKPSFRSRAMTWCVLTVFLSSSSALAKTEFELVAEPLGERTVTGDEDKFRSHHWMREGYGGGIEDLWIEQAGIPGAEDLTVSFNHRAIVRDNDYEVDLDVEKKDQAFVRFYFREFSKYYNDEGGVYHRFTRLDAPELGRDLGLQIGQLSIEAGIAPEVFPALRLKYEKRYKDGDKSRLTWGAAREGSLTRSIVPSFQEIEEDVDVFEIEASKLIKGFDIKAEQHWELEDAHLKREEINLSTTTTAADKKIRVQEQKPEAKVMTTTLAAERWSFEDNLFTGSAYHFTHLTTDELENIFEMSEGRTLTNFTNPKQIFNAVADNDYNGHTWVQSLMYRPWQPVGINVKFKSELIRRHGDSIYPSDTTPVIPDRVVDTTEVSSTHHRIGGLGEAVELRYTGIPRTAVYNELEFEQIRNWLSEDRTSIAGQSPLSANEIFSRETITYIQRAIWTIGTHISPWRILDLTLHYRLHKNMNDYEDQRETQPGASTARSAFIDSLNISMNEIAHRITLKPSSWLRSSFRYQMQLYDYRTGVENEGIVETDMNSHIYSFDISLEPYKKLLFLTSLSRQALWAGTPASSSAATQVPRFNADVTSWFFNTNYFVTDKVTLTQGLEFSTANNFDDFTAIGLPLGVEYHEVGLTAGIKWQIAEHIAIEPKYGFYLYRTSSLAETGNYTAHILWLRTILNWG